jgi:DNA-directed RNA polymerase subunit H (RpoH/RPB5)
MATMEKAHTLEEKRAALIIKYRNFNVDSVEKEEDRLVYRLSRGEERYLMHILMDKKTVGIAFIRELRDQVQALEVTGGIIVADGKYTYSARSNAPEMAIELVPKSLPTFDVFKHEYVPLHEILTDEERKETSDKFHAEPFQFPWIKSTDPISIILGAKELNG